MLVEAAKHPFPFRYRQRAGGDWLPDAVTDTTGKRKRGARRLFGDGAGIICRLPACPKVRLCHLVIPVELDGDFYIDGPVIGRQVVKELLGKTPLAAKLGLGRSLNPHIHVLAMVEHAPDHPCTVDGVYCTPVTSDEHLWNLAMYFSRPSDERACRPRPKDVALYGMDGVQEQRLQSGELFKQSKANVGGRRLPRRSWTGNLPFLKPDVPHDESVCDVIAVATLLRCLIVVAVTLSLAWQDAALSTTRVFTNSSPSAPLARALCHAIGDDRRAGAWSRGPPCRRGMASTTASAVP